jgi:pyridoxine/pyridoxamine 5'-phosphate oxidase
MSHDPHPWCSDLATLRRQVWERLVRGVRDRHAPARHPTLATIGMDGMPQVRTVVLRAADKPAATLDIHTDLHSAKVTQLRSDPRAALHVWDPSPHLQVRIEAEVAILSGAEVADIWHRVPEASRLAYGSAPAPGQSIEAALAYEKSPDPAAFAVLRLSVQAIDALYLGPDHRRARFDRADEWAGQWLAP